MAEHYSEDMQQQSAALIPRPRTSPENDPPLQPPKPDDEPRQEEAPKSYRAAWLAVGAVATASLSGMAYEIKDSPLDSYEQQMSFEQELPANYTLRQHKLAGILRTDTCKKRVTPRQVTDMAAVVVGNARVESKWSASEHRMAIAAATSQLDQAREQLTLAPVPMDTLQALEADSHSESPQAPFSEYMTTFTEVLKPYGLTALFHWDNSVAQGVYERIESLSYEQLDASPQARRVIMATIHALAKLPVELVRLAGAERIVIGNVTSDDGIKYSGLTTNISGDIYLDVTPESGPPDSRTWTTLSHELTHLLGFRVCGTRKMARHDPAYGMLSGEEFKYGKGTEAALEQQPAPPIPVVVRPYGARNVLEDKATLIGEHVFFLDNQKALFAPHYNLSILGYKIALELARLAKVSPALADYYKHSLQLNRLIKTQPQG